MNLRISIEDDRVEFMVPEETYKDIDAAAEHVEKTKLAELSPAAAAIFLCSAFVGAAGANEPHRFTFHRSGVGVESAPKSGGCTSATVVKEYLHSTVYPAVDRTQHVRVLIGELLHGQSEALTTTIDIMSTEIKGLEEAYTNTASL